MYPLIFTEAWGRSPCHLSWDFLIARLWASGCRVAFGKASNILSPPLSRGILGGVQTWPSSLVFPLHPCHYHTVWWSYSELCFRWGHACLCFMRGRYVKARERENKQCGERESPLRSSMQVQGDTKLPPAPGNTGLDSDLFSVGKTLPQPFKTWLLTVVDPWAWGGKEQKLPPPHWSHASPDSGKRPPLCSQKGVISVRLWSVSEPWHDHGGLKSSVLLLAGSQLSQRAKRVGGRREIACLVYFIFLDELKPLSPAQSHHPKRAGLWAAGDSREGLSARSLRFV